MEMLRWLRGGNPIGALPHFDALQCNMCAQPNVSIGGKRYFLYANRIAGRRRVGSREFDATKSPFDLKRLRYFVAIAEAGSLRKAAEVLGMAQPPLSQQLSLMEKSIGLQLFIRRGRGVELTDPGRALLAEAQPLLQKAAEIPFRLKQAAEGHEGDLRIGFTPALAHHPAIPQILNEFRKVYPRVFLNFHEMDAVSLIKEVLDGSLHAALIRSPGPPPQNLRLEKIIDDPMRLVVQRTHPMASADRVALEALSCEDFVMFDRSVAPQLYDQVVMSCSSAGFPIRIVQHAPQKVSAMMLVASGYGMTFVPVSLKGIHAAEVALVEIEGSFVTSDVTLATRKSDHSRLPARFREVCLYSTKGNRL